ncbi:class I SAM-dependent methyltransferase [Oceanobacillus kimchii]|uniref:class I SAM-dependent methyltransferase n=1 Tax=Oceanobacillus kimchii TaxID=746691 RepID=UPI00232CE116|nr:class I SAM-dependent methyltransferase [Oceanobacillus kimchii]
MIVLKRIENNLIESYNKMAEERDKLHISEWKKRERDVFKRFILEKESKNLLEVGAGTGQDSLYFQQLGLEVTSVDLSPEMVKLCIAKGLHAKEMSVFDLEFPDDIFDVVWSLNCLLHIMKEDLPRALHEIKRVLKPDGIFYMGVYGGKDSQGIWEKDTYNPKRFFSFYPDEKIRDVVEKVFKVEYINIIPKNIIGGERELSFQSMILKK